MYPDELRKLIIEIFQLHDIDIDILTTTTRMQYMIKYILHGEYSIDNNEFCRWTCINCDPPEYQCDNCVCMKCGLCEHDCNNECVCDGCKNTECNCTCICVVCNRQETCICECPGCDEPWWVLKNIY